MFMQSEFVLLNLQIQAKRLMHIGIGIEVQKDDAIVSTI